MFEKENKRESESGSLMFTFHVKMISIWTFPTDPGTENRVKYCRASSQFKTFKTIDLRLFNWRVLALLETVPTFQNISKTRSRFCAKVEFVTLFLLLAREENPSGRRQAAIMGGHYLPEPFKHLLISSSKFDIEPANQIMLLR